MPYQAVNTLQIDGDVTLFAIRYEGGASGFLPNEAYEMQAHAGMAHVSFLCRFRNVTLFIPLLFPHQSMIVYKKANLRAE